MSTEMRAAEPAGVASDLFPSPEAEEALMADVHAGGPAGEWAKRALAARYPVAAADALARARASVIAAGDFNPLLCVGAATMVEEGRKLIEEGVPYLMDGVIPDLGMAGFSVAYPKVGKTTLGLGLTKAISDKTTASFLGRAVRKRRALGVYLEDPREYTSWLMARTFTGNEDVIIYPAPLVLNDLNLEALAGFVGERGIGFVYVASFLAGVRALVKDENDNSGMSAAVGRLKVFARGLGIPLLIEAHAGKGEDLSPDADPTKALRGASAAAAEADFVLSLKREGRGAYTTKRVLSGLGRFVNFPPISFDYDLESGTITYLGDTGPRAAVETDWRLIQELGAITQEWRSAAAIAAAAGMVDARGGVGSRQRQRIEAALSGRDGVQRQDNGRAGGARRVSYRLVSA